MALIFAFISIVFIFYDCLVERRQARVVNTARQANAIVDSLFPAMVPERVFKSNEARANNNASPSTPNTKWPDSTAVKNKKVQFEGDTPKKRLKTFLLGSREASSKIKSDEGMDFATEPIADLFPETTIIFADIAGFTAWSSEREPSQVFQQQQSATQNL